MTDYNLTDYIFVNGPLYEKLNTQFHNTEIKKIRAVNSEEVEFLRSCGIKYTPNSPIASLKPKIEENDKRVWIDRCKEVSAEIDVNDLIAKIPDLQNLFQQIVGREHYDVIMNVLKTAFSLKISSANGNNSDWDIFAFTKNEKNEWYIAIFRIEALRINNQWNLYFFKWGKNAVKVDFIGYHLRRIEVVKADD